MVDFVKLGSPAATPARVPATARVDAPGDNLSFDQMLDRTTVHEPASARDQLGRVRTDASVDQTMQKGSVRAAARARTTPEEAQDALATAMQLEGVPPSWQDGLKFIMHKESKGQIDARNPVHSARGLFQLTRANYSMNPNGERSFGNGVEEAQGGIRYIKRRYGTVENAVAHWKKNEWY